MWGRATFLVVVLFFVIISLPSADAFEGARNLATSSSGKCVPYNFSAGSGPAVEMWGWAGWYVLVDIIILFLVLFFELVPLEFAMVASVLMITAAQIITVADMTQGFANAGILAIACLFIVAEGLTATGAIDYFMAKLLGTPSTLGQALLRMMIPCAFIAAWISSTAVVALMIPVVQRWARQINQPPSLLMMPMCYAVHLGGTITIVGTTTNLVVAGLYQQYFCQTMGIFQLSTVGLPVAIGGLGALLLLTPKVLPDAAEYNRRTKYSAVNSSKPGCLTRLRHRLCCKKKHVPLDGEAMTLVEGSGPTLETNIQFTFDALIPAGSVLDQKSIQESNLRQLSGLFLTTVQRGPNTLYSAVGPEFQLCAGDRLTFAGLADAFLPFCREKGLIPIVGAQEEEEEQEVIHDTLKQFTVEAVVRESSDLVGKSLKEVSFRTRYRASVLAIHRAGSKLHQEKLGQVVLKVGDELVLMVSDAFDWHQMEIKRDLKPKTSATKVAELDDFSGQREYVFSMRISPNRRLVGVRALGGLSVEQAGLRNINGVRVVAVYRDDIMMRDIGPEFVLMANDIVYFSAERDGLSMLRRIPGLEDVVDVKQIGVSVQNRRLVEVVISLQSDLLGKTVRESRFRSRFQAAIVSVQRRGQRVLAKIGDIELEPGDMLILDAGPEFSKRFAQDENFLLISEIDHSHPPRMDRFYIAVTVAILMVSLTAATGLDILLFALFAVGIMLATGVLTRERAHHAVDWKIIITVASAFGLSTAMTNTKVAEVLGRAITNLALSTGTGELGVLIVVMVFTEILCALITAKAGALLMFPIAMNAASRLQMDYITMAIALMLGSSDYTTPQGHQTNLMVMGPGAYKFVDYQKMGLPLELFLNLVQLVCLQFRDYWYFTTIGAVLLLGVCALIDHVCVSKLSLSCAKRGKKKQQPRTTGSDVDEEASNAPSQIAGKYEVSAV